MKNSIKKLQGKQYELSLDKPLLMGILNVTPDSFSDGGKFDHISSAIMHAKSMAEDGADILDIGGESTRPGARKVSVDQELDRVIPIIEALQNEIEIPISIDTNKATVMYEAVQAGASLINDVRALQNENTMEIAAQLDVPVCLMHMQGKPQTMQNNPDYENVVLEVSNFLQERATACLQAGIKQDQIIIDPGFGFGKSIEHNLQLLRSLNHFIDSGFPVLVGMSRKSMIGHITKSKVDNRLAGSIALATLAAQKGAHIIRVHDVKETRDALDIVNALSQ